MREIKFRAWNVGSCQCEECVGMWDMDRLMSITYGDMADNIFNDPDFKVMQYTGLKDKEGVEIFEGDRCRFDSYYIGDYEFPSGSGVVSYEDGAFVVDEASELTACNITNLNYEVIGNIYENPELS